MNQPRVAVLTGFAAKQRMTPIAQVIGLVFVVGSAALGIPLVSEYLHTGLVPRFPTAILVTGVMPLGMLSFVTGLVLDTVTRDRREMKMLAYLSYPLYEG